MKKVHRWRWIWGGRRRVERRAMEGFAKEYSPVGITDKKHWIPKRHHFLARQLNTSQKFSLRYDETGGHELPSSISKPLPGRI